MLWHSLNEQGETEYYDILWESGKIEKNMHITDLESVAESNHNHETVSIDAERDYKVKKETILTREILREMIEEEIALLEKRRKGKRKKSKKKEPRGYPYYGYHYLHDLYDQDDFMDGSVGDVGGFSGGNGGGE
mgnify:CR=1 FL=1